MKGQSSMVTHRLFSTGLVLLLACQPSAPPPDSSAAVMEVPAPEATSMQLTPDGWRDLRIGMSRQEVVATLGEDANPTAVGGPDPAQCDQFRPERAPEGLLVMLEAGRLTRISVSAGSDIGTEGGITVGDSAAAVRSHFDARAVSTPHKYWAAPAEYLTVWTVEPPDSSARGVVYEVGEDGVIVHIHAGGASIQYVEGCL
jgi:hypothetical protein